MLFFFKYLRLDKTERVLFYIFIIALILFLLASLKLPVWDVIQGSRLAFILKSKTISDVIFAITASMIAAYVFHYVTTLHVKINHTRDMVPGVHDKALAMISVRLLTEEQRNQALKPSEMLELVLKVHADGSEFENEKIMVNKNLVERYADMINTLRNFQEIIDKFISLFKFSTEVTYHLLTIREIIDVELIRNAPEVSDDDKVINSYRLLSLAKYLHDNQRFLTIK